MAVGAFRGRPDASRQWGQLRGRGLDDTTGWRMNSFPDSSTHGEFISSVRWAGSTPQQLSSGIQAV